MKVWTPEYTKWLASIKAGDLVACTDALLHANFTRETYGYRILMVRHITPKRTRFDCFDPLEHDPEPGRIGYLNPVVSFGKDGGRIVGEGFRRESFFIDPVTPEVTASIIDDTKTAEAIESLTHLARNIEELLKNPWGRDRNLVRQLAAEAEVILGLFEANRKVE